MLPFSVVEVIDNEFTLRTIGRQNERYVLISANSLFDFKTSRRLRDIRGYSGAVQEVWMRRPFMEGLLFLKWDYSYISESQTMPVIRSQPAIGVLRSNCQLSWKI
jgi:hypothetical protein